MTASRPSDWAVGPHYEAAKAATRDGRAKNATTGRELELLYEALAHFQHRRRLYRAAGLKAETAVEMRKIENTNRLIRERRAILEGQATR